MSKTQSETTRKVQLAQVLRDSMHNYVTQEDNELEDEVFFTRLKRFITLLEGSRNEAYYDGIHASPKSPKYISMAKFNSFSKEKQDELIDEAAKRTGMANYLSIYALFSLRQGFGLTGPALLKYKYPRRHWFPV